LYVKYPYAPLLVLLVPLFLQILVLKGSLTPLISAIGVVIGVIGALGWNFVSEESHAAHQTAQVQISRGRDPDWDLMQAGGTIKRVEKRIQPARNWSLFYIIIGPLLVLIGLFIDPLMGFLIDP